MWIHQPAPEPCYQRRWQWRNSCPPEKCLESQNGALTALEFPQNKRTIVGSFDKIDRIVLLSRLGLIVAWMWGLKFCRVLPARKFTIPRWTSVQLQGRPRFQCLPLFSTSLPSLIYANLCFFNALHELTELTSFCCFSFCGPCCSASRAHSSFNIFQTADKESLDS